MVLGIHIRQMLRTNLGEDEQEELLERDVAGMLYLNGAAVVV